MDCLLKKKVCLAKTIANALVPRKFLKEKHFVIWSQHCDEDCFERDLKVFLHLYIQVEVFS